MSPLEELDFTLVSFGFSASAEGAKVAPVTGFWIDLACIEAILA
jgi:hypothetical protein